MTGKDGAILPDSPPRRGRLFVLTAPSGAGKDTLLERALLRCPEVTRCVTFTTRPPRPAETEGVDYHFISDSDFRRMIDEGAFYEWSEVYGRLYGSSRKWVEERLSRGENVLLRIDVQGALAIRRMVPDAVLIFIEPPSREEQERRLRSRDTEEDAEIERRLRASAWEMEQGASFPHRVVNDNLDDAVDRVVSIIKAGLADSS